LSKILNIISFDVPYPPNYGGAIDVFYKLKALHLLGIKIILHSYEYGRGEQKILEKYCESIFYYHRDTKLKNVFSKLPFIVKSRSHKTLIKNLKSNNFPILFEGIHTTFPLINNDFTHRTLLVRAHNIEHHYYNGLAKSETNTFKKTYFTSEAKKLLNYEKIFNKVNFILSISPLEQEYFSTKYPEKSVYTPAFHEHSEIGSKLGSGKYALYHGDLRVSDNLKACEFLIDIFTSIDYQLIIASDIKKPKFLEKINKLPNITFKQLSNNDELNQLLKNAQINVLPTFQNTGIKLKLINALFNGRFCLVNDEMIVNTGLEDLCTIANSKEEFIEKIKALSALNLTLEDIEKRKIALRTFDTKSNAEKIVKLLN